ncbi:MAG: ABC transporter permease [Bacillota bacterium]
MAALFRSHGLVSNFTVSQAVTYAGLAEAMLMVSGISGALGGLQLDEDIRTGRFVVDLLRPIDYFLYVLSLELGRVTYYLVFRGLPLIGILVLFFDWSPPTSILQVLLFLASAAAGILVSNALQFSTLVLGFWLSSAQGIYEFLNITAMLFSGLLLPLAFFPGWLERWIVYLPFAGQFYVPISLFLGNQPNGLVLFAVQCGWVLITLAVARIAFIVAVKRISVQGG